MQALIDTMRKRLCYQAAPETREYAEDLKAAISKLEPEIAWALCPACVFRGGCPEMSKCGYFLGLLNDDWNIGSLDIQERYEAYNRAFYWGGEE